MEGKVTLRQMMAGNSLFATNNQKGYAWEVETNFDKTPKAVNVFLYNLEKYIENKQKETYSFGCFLFEEKEDKSLAVIDGQERIITIILFITSLLLRLNEIRLLTVFETEIFDMVKTNCTYRFKTIDEDNQILKDSIDCLTVNKSQAVTESSKRIIKSFDFFRANLINKEEKYITDILKVISNSSCIMTKVC